MEDELLEFQSSPTPKGGRYAAGIGELRGTSRRFNPRPPRKVGATFPEYVPSPASSVVSILAHPERWALLQYKNLPNFQTINISIWRTSFRI